MTTMRHTSSFEKSMKAARTGHHATVYDVQRDPKLSDTNRIKDKKKYDFPFVGGSTYKGEWKNDCKHGFGTFVSPDGTKYEGDWNNNMKNGRGTVWRKRGKIQVKEYVGEWCDDLMHGVGVFYCKNSDVYHGNFVYGVRSGRGKLNYADGSKYEGEFENDMRCGFGAYYGTNGDIYEGYWLNDQKEGPGKYSYISTRKVYEGEWENGQPKCGEYRTATPEEIAIFNRPEAVIQLHEFGSAASNVKDESFNIPALALESPLSILSESITNIRQDRDEKFGIN